MEQVRPEEEIIMTVSDKMAAEFLAERDEWKRLGCPADHPYARRCAEAAEQASPPAVGVRVGDGYVTMTLEAKQDRLYDEWACEASELAERFAADGLAWRDYKRLERLAGLLGVDLDDLVECFGEVTS